MPLFFCSFPLPAICLFLGRVLADSGHCLFAHLREDRQQSNWPIVAWFFKITFFQDWWHLSNLPISRIGAGGKRRIYNDSNRRNNNRCRDIDNMNRYLVKTWHFLSRQWWYNLFNIRTTYSLPFLAKIKSSALGNFGLQVCCAEA